jgi:ATP-dependent protease ClpP protease subunit
MTKKRTPDWRYQIQARGDAADTTEILIMGDIGENWWAEESITAKSFVRDLMAVDTPNVRVRLNTIGGSVPDGLGIYNALRAFKGTVTVSIEGVALSVGSLIAMAGARIEMAANAVLMIHAPWGVFAGNAMELREHADVLDKFSAAMASSYVRGSMTREVAEALLSDGVDHWYTAEEARDAGLVVERLVRRRGRDNADHVLLGVFHRAARDHNAGGARNQVATSGRRAGELVSLDFQARGERDAGHPVVGACERGATADRTVDANGTEVRFGRTGAVAKGAGGTRVEVESDVVQGDVEVADFGVERRFGRSAEHECPGHDFHQ